MFPLPRQPLLKSPMQGNTWHKKKSGLVAAIEDFGNPASSEGGRKKAGFRGQCKGLLYDMSHMSRQELYSNWVVWERNSGDVLGKNLNGDGFRAQVRGYTLGALLCTRENADMLVHALDCLCSSSLQGRKG